MDRNILQTLNLNGNKLINASLEMLTTPPLDPKIGQYYYDINKNDVKIYVGFSITEDDSDSDSDSDSEEFDGWKSIGDLTKELAYIYNSISTLETSLGSLISKVTKIDLVAASSLVDLDFRVNKNRKAIDSIDLALESTLQIDQ